MKADSEGDSRSVPGKASASHFLVGHGLPDRTPTNGVDRGKARAGPAFGSGKGNDSGAFAALGLRTTLRSAWRWDPTPCNKRTSLARSSSFLDVGQGETFSEVW